MEPDCTTPAGLRPPRISDAEIRAEIERRLSGPPEDLVAYRVQRALEARHGSIPQMARVQRLLCEMRLERQVPTPAARQPEADLDGTSGQVRPYWRRPPGRCAGC